MKPVRRANDPTGESSAQEPGTNADPNATSAVPVRKRRRWARWLLLSLLFLLLVALLGYWRRTELLNWVLNRMEIPGKPHIGEISVDPRGKVVAKDVKFLPRDGLPSGVKAGEIRVEGTIDELRAGKVKSLIIESPEVDLRPGDLKQLFQPAEKARPAEDTNLIRQSVAAEEAGGKARTSSVWQAATWEIRNGAYRLASEDEASEITFTADILGKDARVEAGEFQVRDLDVHVRDLRLSRAGKPVSVMGDFRVRGGTVIWGETSRLIKVGGIDLQGMQVEFTPDNLAALLSTLPEIPETSPEKEEAPAIEFSAGRVYLPEFQWTGKNWPAEEAEWKVNGSLECGAVFWKGGWPEMRALRLALNDAGLTLADQTSVLVPRFALYVPRFARDEVQIAAIDAEGVEVNLGLESAAAMEAALRAENTGAADTASGLGELPPVTLSDLSVTNFQLRLPPSTMVRPYSLIPSGGFSASLTGNGLSYQDGAVRGVQPVRLEMNGLHLDYPRSDTFRPGVSVAALVAAPGGYLSAIAPVIDALPVPPLLEVDRLLVEVAPDETRGFLKKIRRLEIDSPRVAVSALRVPTVFHALQSISSATGTALISPVPSAASGELPAYFGWIPMEASIRNGAFSFSGDNLLLPPVSMNFDVETTVDAESGQAVQRLNVTNLRLHAPVSGAREVVPLATASRISLDWRPEEVWFNKEFGNFQISGLHGQVGQALYDRFSDFPVAETSSGLVTRPLSPPIGIARPDLFGGVPLEVPNLWNYSWSGSRFLHRLREWRIGRVSLLNSTLTVTDILPGVEGGLLPKLTLPVELDERDVPITKEGLAANVEIRPVTLRNLELMSPYLSQVPIAVFPKTTIEFSLSGLFQRRIERIVLDQPTLYVGQDLFWYQEYVRKVAGQGFGGATPQPGGEAAAPVAKDGWSLGTVSTDNGKMIIALKGVPLKAFQLPFPFQFEYDFATQELQFRSEIPERDYEFPKEKLALLGVHGDLKFNLPIPAESNNLVNTVFIREARWREFILRNAWASVTFDESGVNGEFGADGYQGYVSGGFSVRLDKDYSWNAWLSGTDLETREITQALAPDYFLLDTRVSGTMTANGTSKELFDTKGDLVVNRAGLMRISKLDEIVNELPKDWSSLQRESMKVTLTPLQRYEFDEGAVHFRTMGREGNVELKLEGEAGKREIEMRLHDYRAGAAAP